jgi:hypothetical protein
MSTHLLEGLPGKVAQLILSDDTDDTQRIVTAYGKASEHEQYVIDDIFISLCGYSLRTIIDGRAGT